MSFRIEDQKGKRATCVLSCGTVYTGNLEGVDAGFNVLLSECTQQQQEGDSPTPLERRRPLKMNKMTFIRGENVVLLSFD